MGHAWLRLAMPRRLPRGGAAVKGERGSGKTRAGGSAGPLVRQSAGSSVWVARRIAARLSLLLGGGWRKRHRRSVGERAGVRPGRVARVLRDPRHARASVRIN